MENSTDEMLLELLEKGRVKDLIALPGAAFNRLMEIIRRKRYEAQGFRFADEHNPATCETCEG